MTDQSKSAEIEDVLSSIRRLVSGGSRSDGAAARRAADAGAGGGSAPADGDVAGEGSARGRAAPGASDAPHGAQADLAEAARRLSRATAARAAEPLDAPGDEAGDVQEPEPIDTAAAPDDGDAAEASPHEDGAADAGAPDPLAGTNGADLPQQLADPDADLSDGTTQSDDAAQHMPGDGDRPLPPEDADGDAPAHHDRTGAADPSDGAPDSAASALILTEAFRVHDNPDAPVYQDASGDTDREADLAANGAHDSDSDAAESGPLDADAPGDASTRQGFGFGIARRADPIRHVPLRDLPDEMVDSAASEAADTGAHASAPDADAADSADPSDAQEAPAARSSSTPAEPDLPSFGGVAGAADDPISDTMDEIETGLENEPDPEARSPIASAEFARVLERPGAAADRSEKASPQPDCGGADAAEAAAPPGDALPEIGTPDPGNADTDGARTDAPDIDAAETGVPDPVVPKAAAPETAPPQTGAAEADISDPSAPASDDANTAALLPDPTAPLSPVGPVQPIDAPPRKTPEAAPGPDIATRADADAAGLETSTDAATLTPFAGGPRPAPHSAASAHPRSSDAQATVDAETEAAGHNGAGDGPDNLFGNAEIGLDEATLRAMISDIVHDELQGALGARVSRNIRALVRREIARALDPDGGS